MYTEKFKPELQLRWSKIQKEIAGTGADALLVSTNTNLYYAAGRVFSGYCYIPVEGEALFFVRRPVGLTGENVVYIRKPEDIPALLAERNIPKAASLLLELDSASYNECERYRSVFSPDKILNGSRVLREARTVKTPFEIERVRESGIRHAAMYRKITSVYKEGMTDFEFSIELERLARLQGSLGLFRIFGLSMEIFMGSVISGNNADQPSPYDFALGGAGMDPSLPIGCSGEIIRPGNTVMVDMGGNFTGYMTDMSRTFSLGNLPDPAQRAHQTSLAIQQALTDKAKPGTAAADMYNMAVEMAKSVDLERYFMGHKQQAGFIGHGVGIEINEAPVFAPRSKDILKPGMIFALEPKFVIPHVGAVGVENTFLVTETGVEKLTVCNEDIVSLL